MSQGLRHIFFGSSRYKHFNYIIKKRIRDTSGGKFIVLEEIVNALNISSAAENPHIWRNDEKS